MEFIGRTVRVVHIAYQRGATFQFSLSAPTKIMTCSAIRFIDTASHVQTCGWLMKIFETVNFIILSNCRCEKKRKVKENALLGVTDTEM